MRQELSEKHGIKCSGRQGNEKVTCPKCSHTRKNKSDTCLSVTIEGDTAKWNCHHCDFSGGMGGSDNYYQPTAQKKTYTKPNVDAQLISEQSPALVKKFITDRGLTIATAIRFKMLFRRTIDGKSYAIGWPFYHHHELVNVKWRQIDNKSKQLMEKGSEVIFFNLDSIMPGEVSDAPSTIYITEGEFDTMAIVQCGIYAVISVPNGHTIPKDDRREADDKLTTSGRFHYLGHAAELLKNAEKVILATDADKVGADLQYELARRIGREKCYKVNWPDNMKDANEVLQELGQGALTNALKNLTPWPIPGLHNAEDMIDDVLYYFHNNMGPGDSTGYESLDLLYTPKPGSITVITGTPGTGKSEFIDSVVINLAQSLGRRTCFFSPENVREEHIIKLAEKIAMLPAKKSAINRMSEDNLLKAMGWMREHFQFILNPTHGKGDLDWILEKAASSVLQFGTNYIVIDPYNWVTKKLNKTTNETEWVGELLSTLKAFAEQKSVHIFLVAHPAKPREGENGLSLYSISGSANFSNMTDYGVILERAPGFGAQPIAVHVTKVRSKYSGQQGRAILEYNKETGTYVVPEEEMDYEEIFHPQQFARKKKAAEKKTKKKEDAQQTMFNPTEVDKEEIPF